MRLDVADPHVDALFGLFAAGFEHRVGLSDARGRAEKDLQLAASLFSLLGLDTRQQSVGIGTKLIHWGIPGKKRRSAIGYRRFTRKTVQRDVQLYDVYPRFA